MGTPKQDAALAALRQAHATLAQQVGGLGRAVEAMAAALEDQPPPPPPGPTYTLVAEPAVVDEGATVVFRLSTKGQQPGTVLAYQITGVQAGDVSGLMDGVVMLDTDGRAAITVPLVADALTEGPETITCTIGAGLATASAQVRDTSTAPPPPPPPTGHLPARGAAIKPKPDGNNFDNDVIDWIDASRIPAPIPWSLFADADQTIAPSMRGVEPARFVAMHVFGHTSTYVRGQPMLLEAGRGLDAGAEPAIVNVYPAFGNAPGNAAAALRTRQMSNGAPIQYLPGPRGRQIMSGYTTWHGHTRVDEHGVRQTSPRIPMWIGIVLHGLMVYAFRDGHTEIAGQVPLKTFANDFTFYEPDRKLFFVADTEAGEIVRVDRRTTPWTFSVLATGLGRVDSLRAIGRTIYTCDHIAGRVLAVDAVTGEPREVCRLAHAFWVDYRSDGQLVVMTARRTIHVVDPVSGSVGPDLLKGSKLSGIQDWVQLSVDREGTLGERDSLVACSVVGAANTDCYRLSRDGAWRWPFYAAGNASVGHLLHVTDPFGHYPWVVAHHPDEACLMAQGFANIVPLLIVGQPAGHPWQPVNPDAYGSLWGTGRRVMWYGNASGKLNASVPSFSTQINDSGGGLATADHIAEMAPEDAVAFVRAGMLGNHPRPDLRGDALRGTMLFLYRNSLRYLREGAPLLAAVDARVRALIASEA